MKTNKVFLIQIILLLLGFPALLLPVIHRNIEGKFVTEPEFFPRRKSTVFWCARERS